MPKPFRKFLNQYVHFLPLDRQQEVLVELAEDSTPGFDFFLLVVLSCIIASLGLITDSAAVIIGAMLVAPLMSPILGLSLASVAGQERMFRQSVIALMEGIALALLLSTLIGWLAHLLPFGELEPLSNEILSRTQPTPFDLGVALAGGAAAAYALAQPRLSAALPGVAIATALMPPLCTIGIGLSLRESSVAFGATLLFITNFVAISFSGILVFGALGFRPRHLENGWHRLPQSLLVSALLVGLVTIPLILLTLNVVREANRFRTIRQVAEAELAKLPDTQFVSLELQDHNPGLNMQITARSFRQPTYEQTLELQTALVKQLHESVALQLIIIPTTRLDPLYPPTPTATFTQGPSLTPTASPTLTRTATATPTVTVTPTSSPTVTVTPSLTATLTPTPASARISFTGGKWIYLRDAARGKITLALPEGAQVQILYQRELVDGQEWIQVKTKDGKIGWVLAIFLAVYP